LCWGRMIAVDVGVRLGVSYTATSVAAVVTFPDGRLMPLRFDGAARLPTGVAVGDDGDVWAGEQALRVGEVHPDWYVADPTSHHGGVVIVDGREVAVVDLVAATLRRVLAETARVADALPLSEVVIAVNGMRTIMTEAAVRAGLPRPAFVDADDAMVRAAAASGAALAEGDLVLVVHLGHADDRVAVLRHDGHRSVPLTTVLVAAAASLSLADGVDHVASAVGAALTACGLATERVGLVVGVTAPGWYRRMGEAVAERLNSAAAVWWGDEHAAARGALVRLSSERDRLRSYLGRKLVYPMAVAGIGLAAAVTLVGLLTPDLRLPGPPALYPEAAEAMKRPIHYTDHAGLAVVTAFVAIGATAVARWAATGRSRVESVWPGGEHRSPEWAQRLRLGLSGGATTAVAATAIISAIGAAGQYQFAAMLRDWTLWYGVVLMAALSGVGALIPSTWGRVDWHERLRFPLDALVLAAVAMVALHIPLTEADPGAVPVWWWNTVGGAAAGAAVGLLWTGRFGRLAAAGLGCVGAVVGDLATAGEFSVLWAGAVGGWWLTQVVAGLRIKGAGWRPAGLTQVPPGQAARS
jgi:hypothetical protein